MTMTDLALTAVRSRQFRQWKDFRALYAEWRQRARSRGELAMLDDRELRDIGLTRMEANKEFEKPFWEA